MVRNRKLSLAYISMGESLTTMQGRSPSSSSSINSHHNGLRIKLILTNVMAFHELSPLHDTREVWQKKTQLLSYSLVNPAFTKFTFMNR